MDYEALLIKYIEHVRQCEGIDFIDRIGDKIDSDVEFTDQEKQKLVKYHKDVWEK